MRRHRHTLTVEQQQRLAQHPLLEWVYRFKQKLCYLLFEEESPPAPLPQTGPTTVMNDHSAGQSPLRQLEQLGHTLYSWREEIATMWRFSRNNGITEGFPHQNGGPAAPSLRLPQL